MFLFESSKHQWQNKWNSMNYYVQCMYTFVKVESITARLTLIRDENRHEFSKDERDVTSVCVTEMWWWEKINFSCQITNVFEVWKPL